MTTDISLVMLVKDPPPRVASIASLFRPVVDEVVIAVDSTVPESSLGPVESVADELVRIDHAPPFARSAAWLHAQARASWVLVVDGDEVPSVRLLETLAETDLTDYATHGYIGRRWLWRDDRHWLASEPWRENPALRLTPSDDRLVHWHTRLHDQVRVDGPGTFLDGDLYHLDLLVNDEETRRRKVQRYDALNADPLPGSTETMNHSWYLPEERSDELELRPVPSEDVDVIREVLAADSLPVTRPNSPVRLVARAEVEELIRQRPTVLGERRAQLHLRDDRLTMPGGTTRMILVGVRNTGDWVWSPWNGQQGVRLGWRWFTPTHDPIELPEGRADLPSALPPNCAALIPASFTAPAAPGEYLVGLQAVDELEAWFGDLVLLGLTVTAPCDTSESSAVGHDDVTSSRTGVGVEPAATRRPDARRRLWRLLRQRSGGSMGPTT